MGGVGCDGNTDNREGNLIASPEGHRELSPVISWQGGGAIHLLLQEAGTVQLLIYEGKRVEDKEAVCAKCESHTNKTAALTGRCHCWGSQLQRGIR